MATHLIQIVCKSCQVDTVNVQHTFIIFLTVKEVVESVTKLRCGRVKVVEFL